MAKNPRSARCVVSVFGSGGCSEDSDEFLTAYAVGKVLGGIENILVQTGGTNTGTMKGVRLGVCDSGKATLLGYSTWGMQRAGLPLYPDGAYPTGQRCVLPSTITRNTRLVAEADVLIVLPGMGGTLIELLTAFLMCWAPHEEEQLPRIIFVGDYWKTLLAEWKFPTGQSVWDYFNFAEKAVTIVDRPEEILPLLPIKDQHA